MRTKRNWFGLNLGVQTVLMPHQSMSNKCKNRANSGLRLSRLLSAKKGEPFSRWANSRCAKCVFWPNWFELLSMIMQNQFWE